MNILSFLHGPLGWITATWLLLIIAVFAVAISSLIKKTNRIIEDCDSISFPTDTDNLNKTAIGRIIVSSMGEDCSECAEDLISVSSVAKPYRLNLRLAQSTPSILTSLGILGTFIGLSVAVILFDSTTSESIRESINSLLSGMGTAFFTSVIGLSFSIIFLCFERIRYNAICNSVDSLCNRIDKEYHHSTENVIDDHLQNISGQISDLKVSFSDNLDKVFDEKVTPVMTVISNKLENPAQAVVDGLIEEFRNLTNGLSDKLTEKVTSKMNNLLEQFTLATEAMKDIPTSIDTATSNLLKSSDESISAQKAFTEETQKRIEKMASDISNSVNKQISAIDKQLENTASALKGIPEEISNSVDAQKHVTAEFVEQIVNLKSIEDMYSAAIDRITSANNDLANAKSNIATLTSKISVAAESIESASSGMIKSNDKMLKDFEAIYDLNREVTNQVKDYSERIAGIEGGLKGVFQEIEKGLSSYATTSQRNMQGLLNVFTNSVTDACQSISNATTPLHETIGEIFKALDKTEKSAQALLKRVEEIRKQNV